MRTFSERSGLKPWAIPAVTAFVIGLVVGWLLFGLALQPELREETITGVVVGVSRDGRSVCVNEADGGQTCALPALPAGEPLPSVDERIIAEIVWLQAPEPAGARLTAWRSAG